MVRFSKLLQRYGYGVLLPVFFGIACEQKSPPPSEISSAERIFDYQVVSEVHTDYYHSNLDTDNDGLTDFQEAFGFNVECLPPSNRCVPVGVAVRLSRAQYQGFCDLSVNGDAAALQILDLVCAKAEAPLVEFLPSGAAYIRIAILFDTLIPQPNSFAETLIRKLKTYPKDTRRIYYILDPNNSEVKDSDGDSIPDAIELDPNASDSSFTDEQMSGAERLEQVRAPGNRPSVAAFPVIRLIADDVLVTPDRNTSEQGSTATTIGSASTNSFGGSMSYAVGFKIQSGIFGAINETTHTFTVNKNWGASFTESESKTLTETLGSQYNESAFAAVNPKGFVANIGTAPISRSTLVAPATINDTSLGEIKFRVFWDGTQATLPVGKAQAFARENEFTMTKNQYGNFYLGVPIEFDISLREGDIYDALDFGKIQGAVANRNATVIWQGFYTANFKDETIQGSSFTVPYEHHVFAGGNRPSSEILRDGIQLPKTPVTLKDLLVASMGYEEVWEDDEDTGRSYLKYVRFREGPDWRNVNLTPEEIRFVVSLNPGSNGGSSRNPWIMSSEGREPSSVVKYDHLRTMRNYEKMLAQIVRPGDQFFIAVEKAIKKGRIIQAVLLENEDTGGQFIKAVVDSQSIEKVDLLISHANNEETILEMEPANDRVTRVVEYRIDFEEAYPEGTRFFVRLYVDGKIADKREVSAILAPANPLPPKLLTQIEGTSTGQYPYSEVVDITKGTPVLSGFRFDHEKDSDQDFRGIGVIPAPYISGNFPFSVSKPYSTSIMSAVFDKNGDDPYKYKLDYALIDKSRNLEVKVTEVESCRPTPCKLPIDVPSDTVLALVGFQVHKSSESHIKRFSILPHENGKELIVDMSSNLAQQNASLSTYVRVAYVAVPREMLIATSESQYKFVVRGDGRDETTNNQVKDGIKIISGFDFSYTKSVDHHMKSIGFTFTRDKPEVTAAFADKAGEEPFHYEVRYSILKIQE